MTPTAILRALALGLPLATNCAYATEPAAPRDRGFSAGVSIQPTTTAEQLGLPIYPGATPFRETSEDHAGASIGAWGGPFGLQVHALKLRSSEPVEAVARWYREAMARQGAWLDCSQPAAEPAADKPADHRALRCGEDRAKAGGALFKQGTRKHVRVVALDPLATGTRISLVRVEVRGDDGAPGTSR